MPIHLRRALADDDVEVPDHFEGVSLKGTVRLSGWLVGLILAVGGIALMVLLAGTLIEADLREARFLLRARPAFRDLDFGTAFLLARELDLRLPDVEFLLMRVRDTGPGEGFSDPVSRALPRMVDAAVRKIRLYRAAAGRTA